MGIDTASRTGTSYYLNQINFAAQRYGADLRPIVRRNNLIHSYARCKAS